MAIENRLRQRLDLQETRRQQLQFKEMKRQAEREEEEGKLKEELVTYKGSVGDLKIKILTNTDDILKHDMLALQKGEKLSEEQPTKKARK